MKNSDHAGESACQVVLTSLVQLDFTDFRLNFRILALILVLNFQYRDTIHLLVEQLLTTI